MLRPRRAVVGQQVLYRLRIARTSDVASVDWATHPSFPSLRTERLPGQPEDVVEMRDGVAYRVREEQRALFPLRAGRIALPPAELRCVLREPVAGGPRQVAARIPGAELRVRPAPEAGRPPDFTGLVGPVQVTTALSRSSVALGESVHVSVMIAGAANVWDAPRPFRDEGAMSWAEIFVRPPSLRLEPGQRLVARRFLHFDLVPRRVGRFEIPEVRVPYFDPAAERYAVARAPALTLAVTPAAASAAPGSADAERHGTASATGASNDRRSGARGWWRNAYGFALGGAALAVAVALGALSRSRTDDLAAVVRRASAAARSGVRDGELESLVGALRRALGASVSDSHALSSEELAARARTQPELREVADLLVTLDRARFARGSRSPRGAA